MAQTIVFCRLRDYRESWSINLLYEPGARSVADFSDLVGRWVPDPAFDEIIAAQRHIDWARRK